MPIAHWTLAQWRVAHSIVAQQTVAHSCLARTFAHWTAAVVAALAFRVATFVGRFSCQMFLSAALAVGALASFRSVTLRALAASTAGAFALV